MLSIVRRLIAGAIMLVSSLVYASEPHPFVAISDIHFAPFIGCFQVKNCTLMRDLQQASVKDWPRLLQMNGGTTPAFRRDTDYTLLQGILAMAKQAAIKDRAEFVIVLGDWLAHDYRRYYRKYTGDKSAMGYQRFVNKTMQFLSDEVERAFPGLNVYPVVGNNDSYGRDYSSIPNGAFFHDTAAAWSQLIKSREANQSMQKTFSTAGYYAVDLPEQKSVRLIVLNTVLFSYKAIGKDIAAAADQELKWFHQELELAKQRHQHVLVAMHIPVDFDFVFTFNRLWKSNYTDRYEIEMQSHAAMIIGVLAGHLHVNEYKPISFGFMDKVKEAVTVSVSPIYGNMPGFDVYQYQTDPFQFELMQGYNYQIK